MQTPATVDLFLSRLVSPEPALKYQNKLLKYMYVCVADLIEFGFRPADCITTVKMYAIHVQADLIDFCFRPAD